MVVDVASFNYAYTLHFSEIFIIKKLWLIVINYFKVINLISTMFDFCNVHDTGYSDQDIWCV